MPRYDTPRATEDVLRDHEEQLRRLANSKSLENATVGQGGIILQGGSITLRDAGGNDKAFIGALADGSYGIGVAGADGITTLDQIAFGTKVARDTGTVSFGVGQPNPKNQWVWGLGPDIPDTWVSGGRITTVISAQMLLGSNGNPGTVYVGAGLVGPGGVYAPDWSDCLSLDFRGSSGMGTQMAASRELIYTNLPAGYYRIRTGYYLGAPGSPGATADIKSRSLSARLI